MLSEAILLAGLELLKLSLQLTIRIIDTVPPDQHAKNWERYERMISDAEGRHKALVETLNKLFDFSKAEPKP